MKTNKKINISIIVISTIAIFIQTLILSINEIYDSKIFQIIIAILNASVVAIQSLQLNLKRIRSRENSLNNSLDEK